jgi:RNA polymerase sigma-70 factor, ECF subfamily
MSQFGRLRHLTIMETSAGARVDPRRRVEEAFLANERRLGQFLAQMVRDRPLAEDLLQETFLAAYGDCGRGAAVESLDAWLFGIARNRALAALRRTRRMRRAVERLTSRRQPASLETMEVAEIRTVLDRVLSPHDRSLVVLRYVHDFNAAQLAEMTGLTPAAIRKRLERACAALAKEVPR